MIRNPKAWQEWEDEYTASRPVDFSANLRWFNDAWAFARKSGALVREDPMAGLEHKIRMARILNCSKNSFKELPPR